MHAVATLVIEHLDELWTVGGPAPRRGEEQGRHSPIRDGAIASDGAAILHVGTTEEVRHKLGTTTGTRVIDGRGRSLVPGFVDAHTHVVYAGDRRDELRRRLAGASYAEIAAGGGGILSTVRATREASHEQLAAETRIRLAEMLRSGTTTCEAKSGYGLTVESELRMLRVIADLNRTQPLEVAATFMGAHEVPPEFRGRQSDYVDLVVNEMIPAVASDAEWCDVFCDKGFFTPEESLTILEAGRRAGLKPRIHAEELAPSGGPAVARHVQARSADHLVCITPDGITDLAASGAVATLLPAAAFFLKLGTFAPARELIAAGIPVALATDVNPGGGLSPSMPFVMSLACFAMSMTFEEALAASTINGACSLDRQDRVGSLVPGKQMDAVLVDGPAVNLLRVNASPVQAVFKKGIEVHAR